MFEHCAAAGVKATVENALREIAPPPPSPASSRAAARSSQRDLRARGRRIVREREQAIEYHREDNAEGIEGNGFEHETLEGYEGHFEHFADGWTVGFETYTQDADLSPLFKGLPNDECQCEHMGYVIKGKVAFRSGDTEEVFQGGDAYYVGPGHTPILYAGTEVVEFSPTEELGRTMEVVTKNMEEMESASS